VAKAAPFVFLGPAMSDVTTRRATLDDVPAITAIYAESVANATATFEVVPPDEAEMARRMSELTGADYPYRVAEDPPSGNRILGFGYAGPYRSRPAYRNTVEDSIYLSPEARGRGIGGVLLRQLIDDSSALGFRQMVAVIGGSDNAPSIRLHKAAGFVLVGILKDVGYKHGRWLDSVIMQRTLGVGARTPPG
jgi:phosphinothricin acetyltransferase